MQNSIKKASWVPAAPDSDFSIGFLSSEPVFFCVHGFDLSFFITLRVERKTPPRSLVNDLFKKEIKALNSKGAIVCRSEQSELRAKITNSLLPDTLPSYKNIAISCSYNKKKNILLLSIDQSNNRLASEIIEFLKSIWDITKTPKPFINDSLALKILKSESLEGFTGSNEVSVLKKDKGLVRIDLSNQKLDKEDFIHSRYFEDSDVLFMLRYDGVAQNIFCLNRKIEHNKAAKTEFVLNKFIKIVGD